MSEAALLQAIIDSPDDDAPRLVYADYLDERGEATRATFIRVQCELASLPETQAHRVSLEAKERELRHVVPANHNHTIETSFC